jgi:hypothetical protein
MKVLVALLLVCAALLAAQTYDVVVYGGTPGGIAAAISAARLGHSVALIEYHAHVGGMSASGLGKSDIETREAIGGLFREFVGRVYKYYLDKYGPGSENVKLCRDGYYYEPSVAERVFEEMIGAEPKIRVFKRRRLEEVVRSGKRVVGIRVVNRGTGAREEFRGTIFVDATYEGDLAAYAGARYRLGRESRAEFNELHAGVVYQDPQTRTFLAGTTGEGDWRIPAYTFRLCLTTDPANSYVLRDPPPGYDRTRYLGYFDDVKAGRMDAPRELKEGRGYFAPFFGTVVRALSVAELPNRKVDVNMNPRVLGFPFAEENYGYPEADWEERERIIARIRSLTLGLLYFLQNDPQVPSEHRKLANRYHLAKDEFTDNEHFPWQIYVREARRIRGLYTLSEHDVTLAPGLGRAPIHHDSIAAGEFPIDSFPVRKREAGREVLEGYIYMLDRFTQPYQIPYRIMVPEVVDGLIVPVAASATHVAFSTIRLEPTWMAMGQAAGTAAHLAISDKKELRDISVETLQRLLLKQGQVLTYFRDIDRSDPAYEAIQYFGTKGFFKNYYSRSREPLDSKTSEEWVAIAKGLGLGDVSPPTGDVRRGDFCRSLYLQLERSSHR